MASALRIIDWGTTTWVAHYCSPGEALAAANVVVSLPFSDWYIAILKSAVILPKWVQHRRFQVSFLSIGAPEMLA